MAAKWRTSNSQQGEQAGNGDQGERTDLPPSENLPKVSQQQAGNGDQGEQAAQALDIECGRLLVAAKAALPHGSFVHVVEKKLPFGRHTAIRLMAVARR